MCTHSKLHRQLLKVLDVFRKEEFCLAMFGGVHLVHTRLWGMVHWGMAVVCVCAQMWCVCTCSFLCSSLNTVDWFTAMVTSWEDATLSEFCKHEGKGEECQRGRGVRGGGVSEGEGCQRGRGVRGGGVSEGEGEWRPRPWGYAGGRPHTVTHA